MNAPATFSDLDKEYIQDKGFDISEADCGDNQLWVLRTYWCNREQAHYHSLLTLTERGNVKEQVFAPATNGAEGMEALGEYEYNYLHQVFSR